MNRLKDKQLKSLQETCKSVLIESNAQQNKTQLDEAFFSDMKRNISGGVSELKQGNIRSGVGQMMAGALAPFNPKAEINDPQSGFGEFYNKFVGPHTGEGQDIAQYQADREEHYGAHVDAVKQHLESMRPSLTPSDPNHMPFLIALDHFDNGRDTHAMQVLGLHRKLRESTSLQEQSPGRGGGRSLGSLFGRSKQIGLIGVIGRILRDAGDEAVIRQIGIKDLADTIRGQPRAHDMRFAGHNRRKNLGLS